MKRRALFAVFIVATGYILYAITSVLVSIDIGLFGRNPSPGLFSVLFGKAHFFIAQAAEAIGPVGWMIAIVAGGMLLLGWIIAPKIEDK